MRCIEIVVCCIVDGGSTDSRSPVAVGTGDEQHLAQVAWVGHGVLFIHQDFIHQITKFRSGRHRHTAHKHVVIDIIVDGSVLQVADVWVIG